MTVKVYHLRQKLKPEKGWEEMEKGRIARIILRKENFVQKKRKWVLTFISTVDIIISSNDISDT